MAEPIRFIGCVMTLAAMLAPWVAVVRTTVHLAFDAHHHEEAPRDDLRDAATVLHGHGHADGTPAHSHDATMAVASSQAPVPSLNLHPSATAFASTAFAAGATVLSRLDPSPPPRAPIILRI
jgi:hypothetical protein